MKLLVLFVLFVLYGSTLSSSNPYNIKGVKWRQASSEEFLQDEVDYWLNIPDSGPKTKGDMFRAIWTKANAVVIRVDDYRRFRCPKQENYDKGMDDIVDAIKTNGELIRNGTISVEVYLWARFWFEREGSPNFRDPVTNQPSVDATATKAREWFQPVLNKALAAGVLGYVKGIIIIEHNTDRMEDVKVYTELIADKFNQVQAWSNHAGGFFKSRTLMVAGAGFGMDFRNVRGDAGGFLRRMETKCLRFAFIYKFMKAYHENVTLPHYSDVNVNPLNETLQVEKRDWEDMETNNPDFTVAERRAYLIKFGLDDLTTYINYYSNYYPNASNVVFWGDKWDGISRTPPLSRQALHGLLVENQPRRSVLRTNTGYFFNLLAVNTVNPSATKFHLFDPYLKVNPQIGWSGMSIGEEWDSWPQPDPQY